ncbi:putative sterigmatocystin biosynthesis P450 monooxygenase stcS [Colletotrichum spaethianum]|uniref:Sterigmatocystin biosynthesis P450 monooxygenase stcS n=1 Tax=Colletotrichum spaethianum TaxID=700344 RepID=A0AA37LBP7_9PEZI|nr:putative sterigmatocystin biosynthesis P450 monooxygenase stcS [Colletotrichum spaethianum]GKT43619.1 putative sterigmatocystin biosynthesis P450 monooxygenase stcS [Colletotrichum spaethianum]
MFVSDPSLPRSHLIKSTIAPLTDNLDLVSLEGDEWKTWRARFNPSFSNKNVLSLVPGMIKDVQVFTDIVRKRAGIDGVWGSVFPLEGLTTNLTIDVIGRAVLGIELNEQTAGPSRFKSHFMDQISRFILLLNIVMVWKWYSPWRLSAIARNRRVMHSELLPSIERCLSETKTRKISCKTVIDLALKPVLTGVAGDERAPLTDQLFVDTVVSQLKLFMFAGHDTTATALCWVLHCIAKNPEVGRKLRAEHDEILGKDTAETIEVLKQSPHLLNSLIYTGGIIKEALRLYPGPTSLRDGQSHYHIVDRDTGDRYPTDGFVLWDGIRSRSRSNELWPRAKEVIPERWMTTSEDDPLHPKKHSWRMFGIGSRNCIGQELAMTEMKLVLVFMAREIEVDCAWDEWDTKK